MSSDPSATRDMALDSLISARDELKGIAGSADFGLLTLTMLFVSFTRQADWQDWPDLKDIITDGLLGELRDELGPGIEIPMRTLRGFSPSAHASFIKLIDRTVKQLGYVGTFQLILEEFAWDHQDVFTPASVVEVLVNTVGINSSTPTVYDPFCRAGELLVAAGAHASSDSAIWGEVPNLRDQAIARMNLRLNEIDGGIGQHDNLPVAGRPKASVILANPPFNVKDWAASRDHEWRYGPPPPRNANFAWLQYVLERLEADGKAAVLMANNAAFSANERERRIRERMVLDGCIGALISLPPSLFRGTAIGTMVWLLKAPAIKPSGVDSGVVFVDATKAGHMTRRNRRELSDSDIREIIEATTGRAGDEHSSGTVRSIAASLSEIQERDFNLSPAAYMPGGQSDSRSSTTDLIDRWESDAATAQRSDSLAGRAVTYLTPAVELFSTTSADWPKVRLSDVCKLIPGAPTKDVIGSTSLVPVLKPKNLVSGRLAGKTDMMDAIEAARQSRYLVENGDLLCARTGTMGRVGLVAEEQQGWVFGSGLICIRVKPDAQLDPHFLAAYFMSPAVTDWVLRNAGGTSIPSISAKTLSILPVSLPHLDVQHNIAEIIDGLGENVAAHERARQAALELRDSLLPRFFSGQIPG